MRYSANLTVLLKIDFIRITTECKQTNIEINYSYQGGIPFTLWHYPKNLGFHGHTFSDNILLIGQKLKT
jgi:hypothetical protein